MATVRPFSCYRPAKELADKVAALPYDVYNRAEAKEATVGNPYSFLRIDRAETTMDDSVDTYDPSVYQQAKKLLEDRIADNTFVHDTDACYYVYELIMDGRHQTGIVACCSVDDYISGKIKKHENTREEKEIDRINHVNICSAHSGPIFLAYRSDDLISGIVNRTKEGEKLYGFTSDDGITHNVWKIADETDVASIKARFENINNIYIADGHHRAASAVKVGLKRREENPNYTGNEEFNFFLSVLFPEDQLMIMPYNRVVKDLNGMTSEEFMAKLSENFKIEKVDAAFQPVEKCTFGMYLDNTWYKVTANDKIKAISDPVSSLDVSVLSDYVITPILGIEDLRKSSRIDFIGGIRGLKELERRCSLDMKLAFSMYPTSIQELFAVADAGMLMPPKSTWFEPKLRSGLFIHRF